MLLSNLESIPNRKIIKHLGLVQGYKVQTGGLWDEIKVASKGVKDYSSYLLNKSYEEALAQMQEQAQAMGANAVINIRLDTSAIASAESNGIFAFGTAAYGTAVVLED